jgi:hypothetical protein
MNKYPCPGETALQDSTTRQQGYASHERESDGDQPTRTTYITEPTTPSAVSVRASLRFHLQMRL